MGHGRTLAQRPGSHNRIRSTNRRSLRCPGPRRLRPSLSSPRRPYHDLRRSWRSPRAPRHHHRGSRWHRSRHFRCRQGQPRPHFLRPPRRPRRSRRPRRRLPSCSTPRFPHGASEASSVTHLRDCGLRSRRSSQHTNVVVPLEAMVGTSIEAWSSATLETVTGAGSIHVYVARSKRWTFTTPNSARANSRQSSIPHCDAATALDCGGATLPVARVVLASSSRRARERCPVPGRDRGNRRMDKW